jgi:hypothetical protein
MRPGNEPWSSVHPELAALDGRLRAAQRDAVAAMTAIGAIVVMLAVLGGWAVI